MKESANSAINPLTFDLPELSLQVASFIQIAIFAVIAGLAYYVLRKCLVLIKNSGLIEQRSLIFKIMNGSTFVIPSFVFLYGLTNVSQDSLFVSLLFFVIFSVVFAFSLVDPIKALFASAIINLRGDLQVGDYVHIGSIEGRVQILGAFNIVVQTRGGSRSYIPPHQFMRESYEIHAKKGGPSISLKIPETHFSKKQAEQLANLCPYKRSNSDVRVTSQDGTLEIHMEVTQSEFRGNVRRYFESYKQKRH